jgi:ATP-dependent RNA helicase SUPV3L1/SUV3
MRIDFETRIRNVTAVLGPTNTGKTHLAIERMLGHETGMIGLPLRLLAREVYDRIVRRVGADKVALITGEEKIKPESPRFWVSTVEAMPRDVEADFLAIDEVQLAADPERGHVFTDRMLHARGKLETLLLGAGTMREAISDLIPGANFISRPRLSKLSYAGQKKITRLPARAAVVAFSATEVYAIAELIRRQRGGAAVVLGALSPRTRNAQVALYQSGDVDFLVATDAIGMGLNLDVDHVAFAAVRKFDGQNHRTLSPAELAQIAGRAGRHMNDGSFGVTGDVDPLEQDLIERIETHTFDTVKTLQWRSRDIDFSSLDALRDSLRQLPAEKRLTRARMADDLIALETVSQDREVIDLARGPAAVATLWDVCQVPDYRKISSQNHAELVATLFKYLMTGEERIPEDWFGKQVALADRTDGDIDTLATRLSHIRTWTFVSNRPAWLKDPGHWQERTRAIEDSLSDALHEQLTQRFVDRRTSALMRGMRDKEGLVAEIADDGAIRVENHYVGRIKGFVFSPDAQAEGIHGKAARSAAAQVLSKELAMRARRVAAAKNDAFKLTAQGRILWRGDEIARVEGGENPLKPQVVVLADEHLQPADKERVQERITTWVNDTIRERLKPLIELGEAQDIAGLARGIAFRLAENFGVLKRELVAQEMKSLDQAARAQLRRYGVRFGAFNIYFPALVKPASAELSLALWLLKNAAGLGLAADVSLEPPRAGLTSTPANPALPEAFYRTCGFHVCGPRAIRVDILERLADLIRPLLAWRPGPDGASTPPKGSTGDGGFKVTPEMMSILGCSPDELGNVLKSLGFRLDRRPVPASRPEPDGAMPVPPAEVSAAEVQAAEVQVAEVQVAEAIAAPIQASEPAIASAPPDVSPPSPASERPAEAIEPEPSLARNGGVTEASSVAASPPQPENVGSTPPDPAAAAMSEEIKYEDIWRPRRRGDQERGERRPHRGPRHKRDGDRRRPGHGAHEQTKTAEAPAERPGQQPERAAESEQSGGKHHDRHRHRRRDDRKHGGDRRRTEERPPRQMRSQPTQKRGEVDPDSPFAALGALKIALEKRSQEQGSS